MEQYKKYMDQIAVPDKLHEKLICPKPRTDRYVLSKAVVSLACLCCVAGLLTMVNGGVASETTSALETTCAAAQDVMDEEIVPEQKPVDGATPESLTEAGTAVPEAAIGAPENGTAVVGSGQETTIFPAFFEPYLPVVDEGTYQETKFETAEGDSVWRAKWEWSGQSASLILIEIWKNGETPIGSGREWTPQELWKVIRRQVDDQFLVLDQRKIDWQISFQVGHYEVVYTLRGMQHEEVLGCLRTIPFLADVEEDEG